MKESAVRQAVTMAAEGLPVFLTTVGPGGMPHLTTVGAVALLDRDHLRLTEWFCPQTVENTRDNRRVSLTVWDPAHNTGWQLTGQVEVIESAAMMDGYDPNAEPMPQILSMLDLHVEQAMRFHHGPHTDKEE
jgi:hypothetical protein